MDSVSSGCNAPKLKNCYTIQLAATPSWVYFDSGMTVNPKTATAAASAAFSLWAKVPAYTMSAQTVIVTATYSTKSPATKSYTLNECNPAPLIWTPTAGFTISA